jgi:hypothetical protein
VDVFGKFTNIEKRTWNAENRLLVAGACAEAVAEMNKRRSGKQRVEKKDFGH